MGVRIRVYEGAEALEVAPALVEMYRRVFGAPPWNEPEEGVGLFARRLRTDVLRPGFVAALAGDQAHPLGFATAWLTQAPFPTDRRYPDVTRRLGAERVRVRLVDALEVDELAVVPEGRGAGLGTRLLDTMRGRAPRGRAWLVTSARSPQAVGFYRGRGWQEATEPDEPGEEIVVFLSPESG
ncbi:GNAT family N-acetyltransferase [Marinactinospora thermotolerans]|uniref:Acetyltransferases n=1 Tax=Marinactinospora thermotolerans DSM 45154 TaxID=1122192 RepID=A0A1T4T4J6_9ACTN|nr:GNAT family N-acetyltransferase [Marinactinospora thermotolerans]SKA35317.1 Acetyltransferases [Marinactinospora thermotolerans DSM 45154]